MRVTDGCRNSSMISIGSMEPERVGDSDEDIEPKPARIRLTEYASGGG